ncbi:MAG: hypothetical protein ACJAV1_001909 [Paraglaciecola sp.]|jgi:hypothetical protein
MMRHCTTIIGNCRSFTLVNCPWQFEYYESNVASSIQTFCSGCHSDSKGNFGTLSSDNLANYNVLAQYISDGFGYTLDKKRMCHG